MKTSKILGLATAAAALAVTTFASGEADAQRVRWKMASAFPSSLVQLGTLGKGVEEKIEAISGGEFRIRFYEPKALVPPLETWDAVSQGSIDAAWTAAGYWAGKIKASPLFTAVPFGPAAPEYLAWMYYGGGLELWQEIAHRSNIHPIPCGIIAPEASGWFREEIKSIDELVGLKMRFFGLGARVMEKIGVSTQLIAGGDIYPALELGSIDATEFSMPAIDLNLGFYQVAKHYYFPGWHQQSSILEIEVNLDKWKALTDQQRAQLEMVCGDNMREGLAEGEAIQWKAIQTLEEKGVQIHRWPQEVLDTLEKAWNEVVEELRQEDEDFARVWESLSTFRANYATWKELAYLK